VIASWRSSTLDGYIATAPALGTKSFTVQKFPT
jgi:hypothetical protein